MTKVTNTTRATQAFYVGKDDNVKKFVLTPGQTRDDVELDEDDVKRVGRVKGVLVEGYSDKQSPTLAEFNNPEVLQQVTAEIERLRARNSELDEELTTTAASVADLQQQIADRDAEIEQLKATLTERDAQQVVSSSGTDGDSETSTDGDSEPEPEIMTGLEAKHRGGGSYSVMQGDVEVVQKLNVDQKDEFNKLDDAGKTKWVLDAQKAAE